MTKFFRVNEHYFMAREGKNILHVGPEVINNLTEADFYGNPANFIEPKLYGDPPIFRGDEISSDTFLDALSSANEKMGLYKVFQELEDGEHG